MSTQRTDAEKQRDQIIGLALGRIFRLGSRPTQPGDVEQYEAARRAIYAAYERRHRLAAEDTASNDPYRRQEHADEAEQWAIVRRLFDASCGL